MTNIEQLKKETDEIKKGLEELKNNVSLSETEKKDKADALKTQAETTKKKIEKEIHSLENKTDDESKKKKEEAETLLNSFNETMNLYSSILSLTDSEPEDGIDQETSEEKGFLGKTRDWVGEQWDDVRDKNKWKTEGGKNLLRTAGFVATGVGAVALAYKGIKSLWNRAFGDDEDEKSEETDSKPKPKKRKKSSWWKKGLAAVGIGVAGFLGYKNWDKIKEFGGGIRNKIIGWFEKEKPLEIDEAVKSATSEVRNGKIKENPFRQHFEGGITYNEGNSTIESYGEATKVDVENKTIEGLKNIKFPNYEELIHAANIINFARRNFAGKCQNSEPFDISDGGGGDLVVHLANGEKPEWISASDSSLWTKILGGGGCVIGAALGAYVGGIKGAIGLGATLGLGGAAAGNYLDNDSSIGNTSGTVASGANLKRFKNCLNDQKDENGNSLWPKKSHQELNPDNYSPIEKELNEIVKEIEESGGEGTGGRDLKSEQNKENPEIFTISSYNQNVEITLKGCTQSGSEHIDYSKITSIKIGKYRKDDRGDGLEIDFPHNKEGLKEAIKVINLTNFIRDKFAGKGETSFPFGFGLTTLSKGAGLDFDSGGDLDIPGFTGSTTILKAKTLEKNFPTLFKDVFKQLGAIPEQDMLRKQAISGKDYEPLYKSHYIRYLHQMRNEFDSQTYWVNGQQ